MRRLGHLMRRTYQTDHDGTDYAGAFSQNIGLNDGWEIVGVDWSKPGWVEVTFLIPGSRL